MIDFDVNTIQPGNRRRNVQHGYFFQLSDRGDLNGLVCIRK